MIPRVLVVDDEPDLETLVRQRFRRQIRDERYDFVFARNGAEALEMLTADSEIGIVMSDINMPQMDGLTLLSRIGAMDRIVKTVMVSAYDDLQNIRTAMNRGAYDFLTKPINFQDFETTLEKTIQELAVLRQAVLDHEQLAALQHELIIATRIQQSILPRTFPPFPGRPEFDIHAEMLPARQVSGDFYDFFLLDDSRVGFVIGDVAGKGVPAAIFMAVSRTLFRATALRGDSPAETLNYVNRILSLQSEGEVFVTLFYAVLDYHTGEMQFSSGGQPPPYLLAANGDLRPITEPRGFMVGLFGDASYEMATLKLEPGDAIFLYTDGVTEAESGDQTMFSYARLAGTLRRSRDFTAKQIVSEVLRAVKEFARGTQSDDITALALRYTGPR